MVEWYTRQTQNLVLRLVGSSPIMSNLRDGIGRHVVFRMQIMWVQAPPGVFLIDGRVV